MPKAEEHDIQEEEPAVSDSEQEADATESSEGGIKREDAKKASASGSKVRLCC